MDRMDRIDSLFLNDKSASFRPFVRLPTRGMGEASIGISRGSTNRGPVDPLDSPTFSDRSSVGASSRLQYSDSISRRSSASSASTAPSIHFAPPWALNQPQNMSRIDYTYNLPCEFAYIYDCSIVFHPEQWAEWIQHEESHFDRAGPPQTSVCLFCDDRFENWAERMKHVGSHYHANARFDNSRPDFFVIEQLYRGNRLSKREFDGFMAYTERPDCGNLVDNDYKTPEMEARELRQRAEPHRTQRYGNDLAREDRQMRRELGSKGKGRSERTHRSSGSNQIIYQKPRS